MINDDENEKTEDSNSIPRKKKGSVVWNYFTKIKNQQFAKCNNCGHEYKTSGNTSNLQHHINRCLPSQKFSAGGCSTDSVSSKSSISFYCNRQNEYSSESIKKKELDKALMHMVCDDYQPFNIVNDTGFRNFVNILDPRYIIPSTSTLRDKLMKSMFEEAESKLF